jgi:hypothetical protein
MNKMYITIAGAKHRVEANWNAITSYLTARGKDSLQGLSDISSLSPSELPHLMAACVNEGERLEGRESSLTAEWIGENCGMTELTEFVSAFCRMVTPQIPADKAKKG